ncbi:MAG TPA: transcriptional regulator [Verrucomicrobiae bacterium]|jgi:DNA-binding MarR family transcriptional regulator|nr:transcriptional regulator [Verrucomicrobiae bacterium]
MDDLLLSKIRLAVIAELLGAEWVAFSALVRAAQTTNGNLGAHLGKLVESGYVDEEKTFVDRRPQTRYRLSERGRGAFVEHVREMQNLLQVKAQ